MQKTDLTLSQRSVQIGFTLAEVLITLAIIGVVAALTIPSVVRNYQKTQTLTQLKKVYSALANTTNLAIADNGPITGWEVGTNMTGQAAVDFSDKYLIPYLKIAKNCGNATGSDCSFTWVYLNNASTNTLASSWARFFLNDGTFIAIQIENSIREDGLNYKQAYIYIDINGQKKPNKFGKDLFYFKYYIFQGTQSNSANGKFVPYSYNTPRTVLTGSTGNVEACNSEYRGLLCSALILQDNWQISDDYPW